MNCQSKVTLAVVKGADSGLALSLLFSRAVKTRCFGFVLILGHLV